jgi:aquaporin Z
VARGITKEWFDKIKASVNEKSRGGSKKKYLAEIVGTFILVYAIASAATVYSDSGQLGIIGIGLVHAFVLAAVVYAIGYISGAHVNPAVTIGFLVARKLGGREAALYIGSQILGAVIGAGVVYATFGSSMAASVTLPADDNVIRAFVLETVMTFTLVYVVSAATTSENKIGPLAGTAVGFTLGFNVLFGGSISGGSLNPARSFGPALVSGNFDFHWIYWVAPIIGGLIAAGLYKGLHKDTDLASAVSEIKDKPKGIKDKVVGAGEGAKDTVTGRDTSSTSGGTEETTIPVMEEDLEVSKKESTKGEATITKEPITETKEVEVPVTHEEAVIERRPASDSTPASSEIPSRTEVNVPLKSEEVEVTKKPYVKEEVSVKKKPVTETQKVSEEVTSEQVNVEGNL